MKLQASGRKKVSSIYEDRKKGKYFLLKFITGAVIFEWIIIFTKIAAFVIKFIFLGQKNNDHFLYKTSIEVQGKGNDIVNVSGEMNYIDYILCKIFLLHLLTNN